MNLVLRPALGAKKVEKVKKYFETQILGNLNTHDEIEYKTQYLITKNTLLAFFVFSLLLLFNVI